MTIYLKKSIDGLSFFEKGSRECFVGVEIPRRIKNIGILNLMPNKCETETQFLKIFNSTKQQVCLRFLRIVNHRSKNTSQNYIEKNYETLDDIKKEKLDGIIITGAPLERLSFEEVDYWEELKEIFKFIDENIKTALFICWSAQAALYYYYGIRKDVSDKKIFGVHKHYKLENEKIINDIKFPFKSPNSRYTKILKEDLKNSAEVKTVLYSNETEELLLADKNKFFMLGHIEYDKDTLKREYFRDVLQGIKVEIPKNYFPFNNINKEPINSWEEGGITLLSNWIKYYVSKDSI